MPIGSLARFALFVFACFTLGLGGVSTAHAQTDPASAARATQQSGSQQQMQAIESTRNGRQRPQAAIDADAKALALAAGVQCDVVEAANPGQVRRGQDVYEVDCASGPGFILIEGTPPTTFNCVILAGRAALLRAEDPAAAVGTQCALPGNVDTRAIFVDYARSASIACSVDGGAWIGSLTNGGERYEIGCAGADGYWLEVPTAGAPIKTLECLEVISADNQCALTTPQEQNATLQTRLAGSAAPACTVQQARFVGGNANGRFYEAKCSDGTGFIERFEPGGAFAQAYPCAQAQAIGGGCKLVDTAALTANLEGQRTQQLAQLGVTCATTQSRTLGRETGGAQRTVVEYSCSDRELGLIAFFPDQADVRADAIDCLTAAGRRVICQFTTTEQIKAVVDRMMKAGGKVCDVDRYAVRARMADEPGEVLEVQCTNGTGYYGGFPVTRVRPKSLLTCTEARTVGDTCEL